MQVDLAPNGQSLGQNSVNFRHVFNLLYFLSYYIRTPKLSLCLKPHLGFQNGSNDVFMLSVRAIVTSCESH